MPCCKICADQDRLAIHSCVPCELLDGLSAAIQRDVAMVAAGVDVLFSEVVLCGSAAVQCVAEHHHSPALGHICPQHLYNRTQ